MDEFQVGDRVLRRNTKGLNLGTVKQVMQYNIGVIWDAEPALYFTVPRRDIFVYDRPETAKPSLDGNDRQAIVAYCLLVHSGRLSAEDAIDKIKEIVLG